MNQKFCQKTNLMKIHHGKAFPVFFHYPRTKQDCLKWIVERVQVRLEEELIEKDNQTMRKLKETKIKMTMLMKQ